MRQFESVHSGQFGYAKKPDLHVFGHRGIKTKYGKKKNMQTLRTQSCELRHHNHCHCATMYQIVDLTTIKVSAVFDFFQPNDDLFKFASKAFWTALSLTASSRECKCKCKFNTLNEPFIPLIHHEIIKSHTSSSKTTTVH